MGRAPCCDKAKVKKGPWSPEEDATLKSHILQHGTGGNWIALPNKIGLKRCGKSCRLRWLNYLRPNIKHGGFTQDEDNIICTLYTTIGSRWSIIAAQLPGRTDNDIKNYWNTRLKKKLLHLANQSQRRSSLSHSQDHTPRAPSLSPPTMDHPLIVPQMESDFSYSNNNHNYILPHQNLSEPNFQHQNVWENSACNSLHFMIDSPINLSRTPTVEEGIYADAAAITTASSLENDPYYNYSYSSLLHAQPATLENCQLWASFDDPRPLAYSQ